PATDGNTLSLHDALPISRRAGKAGPPNHEPGRSGKGNRGAPGKNPRVTESQKPRPGESQHRQGAPAETERREGSEASKAMERRGDRKSTRLNSSHVSISY